MVFRVLVTDADTKHSISIQRSLHNAQRDLEVIAHSETPTRYAHLYRCHDRLVSDLDLPAILRRCDFDMVIPVGGASVLAVDAICREKAVLPTSQALAAVYDKRAVMELAGSLAIPIPHTFSVKHEGDLNDVRVGFPCVVKPAQETEAKFVIYARDRCELRATVVAKLHEFGTRLQHGLLVQEFVHGPGFGFFALYDQGSIRRVFMHQRLREWPPSGGASTAARAVDDPVLAALGTRILDALQWHGVAMVEFKRDPASGRYNLMEINGKFWGSTELSVAAGVEFARDLVRMFRGEQLAFSDAYDREATFAWPLDGDLLNILSRGAFGDISSYWRSRMKTNLGQCLGAELRKAVVLPAQLTRFLATRA